MNPSANVALREHRGALLRKHAVSGNVVEVIVRVDDELDRQLRALLNLCEELLCRILGRERVDDDDAIVTDHEACIRRRWTRGLRVVNRGPGIRADLFQCERWFGRTPGAACPERADKDDQGASGAGALALARIETLGISSRL